MTEPSLAALLLQARGGLSVDDLARKARLSSNSVRNAESGKLVREATMRAILKAAKPSADLRAAILSAYDQQRAADVRRKAMARAKRVAGVES